MLMDRIFRVAIVYPSKYYSEKMDIGIKTIAESFGVQGAWSWYVEKTRVLHLYFHREVDAKAFLRFFVLNIKVDRHVKELTT